jgi:hypothetical protein
MAPGLQPRLRRQIADHTIRGRTRFMKYAYTAVAGLSLVALAFGPAMAGDQKAKTSDKPQLPSGGASVDSKTDLKTDTNASPSVGADTQTQGSVTTESPSASPSTTPSTQEKSDSTANPSMKSDTPSKDKPKY